MVTYQTKSKVLGVSTLTHPSKQYIWLERVDFDYVQRFELNTAKALREMYKDDKDMQIDEVVVIAITKLDDTE